MSAGPATEPATGALILTHLRSIAEQMSFDAALLIDHPISEDLLPQLYNLLDKVGYVDRLIVVLGTQGGSTMTARRVSLLVREFAREVEILVPYQAKSAGTLICLGATKIIMGPMTELSPIDPQISAMAQGSAQDPGLVSSEEIREFQSLASDWFSITRPEDAIQILALLAQRIFPATLTSLYRAERLTREIALELLSWQLTGDELLDVRRKLVDQLISGFSNHDYPILHADAQRLGLATRRSSAVETKSGWQLRNIVAQLSPPYLGPSTQPRVVGVLSSTMSAEVLVHQYSLAHAESGDHSGGGVLNDTWVGLGQD